MTHTTHHLGVLTIGHSPRPDLYQEFMGILGPNIRLTITGALDGVPYEHIVAMAPSQDDIHLITRLNDGRSVIVGKKALIPRLQEQIGVMEAQGVAATVISCTGPFPRFISRHPILLPDRIIGGIIPALLSGGKLGIIVPIVEQEQQLRSKWQLDNVTTIFTTANPYEEGEQFHQAAQTLKAQGVNLIVLDCMGYSHRHKTLVQEHSKAPVILSRTLVARVAAELLF